MRRAREQAHLARLAESQNEGSEYEAVEDRSVTVDEARVGMAQHLTGQALGEVEGGTGSDQVAEALSLITNNHARASSQDLNPNGVRTSMVILWTSQTGRMMLKRSLSDAALEANRREEIRVEDLSRAV